LSRLRLVEARRLVGVGCMVLSLTALIGGCGPEKPDLSGQPAATGATPGNVPVADYQKFMQGQRPDAAGSGPATSTSPPSTVGGGNSPGSTPPPGPK